MKPYAQGWAAMVDLVTRGHSWSGHERHVCYVNERSGRFANVSFVSGLDHRDDGRALGLVDWDSDGDLDVWFRNRTAPRLRLMRNTRAQNRPALTLELEGTDGKTNRDAIGAVVEVIMEGGERLAKSVRAGDLFMSQSSKRLHFGLGGQPVIRSVRVLWPGGNWESFGEIAPGNLYRLRQGTGRGELVRTHREGGTELAVGALAGEPDRGRSRVLLPTPVPLFPSFQYRDRALQPKGLPESERPCLLVFWSSLCLACRDELPRLAREREPLTGAGIDVLGLAVDGIEQSEGAYAFIDGAAWPFAWGFVEEAVLERLEHLQEVLFDRAVPLAVPLALLVDGKQHVLALYRGTIDVDEVIADARATVGASDEQLHHVAPPLAGRWFTNPVPRVFVAENLARRFEERFPEDALPYLHLAFEEAEAEKKESLRRELGFKHRRLAQQQAEANRLEAAVALFEKALVYTPESAALHHNYGVLLARYGHLNRAQQLLQRALQLDESSEATRKALQMVMEAMAAREGGPGSVR